MKDLKTYKESGILELFVYGILPHEEMRQVAKEVQANEALLREVQSIENAVMQLASAAAPHKPVLKDQHLFIADGSGKVLPLSRKRIPATAYIGWAAAILLLAALGYMYTEKSELETQIVETERALLIEQGKALVFEENLQETKSLLNVIRNKNVLSVPLGGQDVAPEAYAAVFWDEENNKAYIDVNGLPKPPEGKVYQIWSLTLDPLTPTSLGTVENYNEEGNQIFVFENPHNSEAFGITLEPAGGSDTPTMEQLYTLGIVSS